MIDFTKEYADLICEDIPKIRLESYPHRNPVPENYRKKFIHPENGFVKKYCEDYDERSSSGDDYLSTALKACKAFNEELGEKTFDK